MNIVLVEPEIPQNTGNISRTCAAAGVCLHMVKPFGFSLEDKYLKRAGLDYWDKLEIYYYDCFQEIKEKYSNKIFYYATTKAGNVYTSVHFPKDCFIVFGKETKGLPESLLKENKEFCLRIPMVKDIRSLNLSNSVAIILYEALRQNDFSGLMKQFS